jgi:ubiquitin-activating enzyme E1
MDTFDEKLYSRQLYVIGKDAMSKMVGCRILISCYNNFSGLGTEIAKNILLAGIRNIDLHCRNDYLNNYDQNFYEGKISKIGDQLSELNPESNINIVTNIDTIDYDLIIYCSYPFDKINQKNKFICCDSMGLSGYVICDFKKYFSTDVDGEPIIFNRIKSINDNIIETYDDHKLYSGDVIKINTKTFIVRTISTREFNILNYNVDNDIKNNKNVDYDILCYTLKPQKPNKEFLNVEFSTIKIKKEFEHKSLKNLLEKYDDNAMNIFDMANFNSKEMYIFYKLLSLNEYENIIYENNNDIEKITNTLTKFILSFKNLYEEIFNHNVEKNIIDKISNLYLTCYAKITPINSIIGSIVSHQIIKNITNKGNTKQILFYDCLDILSRDHYKNILREKKVIDKDPINSIFGNDFVKYLNKQNIFIVGAGAIGCEHGKNMIMMGTNIIITDMDQIEKSNLSRQFLFRNSDINKSKSMVALEKLSMMNIYNRNIIAYNKKIYDDTKHIFNKKFYDNIDIVMNALDNVDARVFMDEQCLINSLPLIESGTLGSKGSIQSIIPFKSKTYSDMIPNDNSNIPVCTLKQNPYKFEHVVQYGKDYFHGKFNKDIEKIEIDKYSNVSIKNIISLAIKEFNRLFNISINDILNEKDNEKDFWKDKMKPQIINFDSKNKYHIEFIILFVKLYSMSINIKYEYDEKYLTDCDKDINEDNFIVEKSLPIEFEKDDDLHVDFVRSLSNLRAKNYGITTKGNFDVKKIAGKIIPAISTTTSLVSGLSAIETIKVICEKYFKNEQSYKDGSFNMNIDTYGIGLISESRKYNIDDVIFNKWELYSNNLTYNNIDKLVDDYELIEINGETLELETIYDINNNLIYEDDEILSQTTNNLILVYFTNNYEKIEIYVNHSN